MLGALAKDGFIAKISKGGFTIGMLSGKHAGKNKKVDKACLTFVKARSAAASVVAGSDSSIADSEAPKVAEESRLADMLFDDEDNASED